MTKPTVAEPTAPKPIEGKAPEKKENPWAEIRGMRDSDEMIADLEAGGITSLDNIRASSGISSTLMTTRTSLSS